MLTKTKKQQLYAALDAIAIRKARIRDANEIVQRIKERKALIRFRLESKAYVKFDDLNTKQQDTLMSAYFYVYNWSFPNGSCGRAIDVEKHKNVLHTYQGTCVYLECEDQLVLVNTDKRKVNAQVDFGIHHYSGDVEMVDIKMNRLEKL
jgi:hypothetical protein